MVKKATSHQIHIFVLHHAAFVVMLAANGGTSGSSLPVIEGHGSLQRIFRCVSSRSRRPFRIDYDSGSCLHFFSRRIKVIFPIVFVASSASWRRLTLATLVSPCELDFSCVHG